MSLILALKLSNPVVSLLHSMAVFNFVKVYGKTENFMNVLYAEERENYVSSCRIYLCLVLFTV